MVRLAVHFWDLSTREPRFACGRSPEQGAKCLPYSTLPRQVTCQRCTRRIPGFVPASNEPRTPRPFVAGPPRKWTPRGAAIAAGIRRAQAAGKRVGSQPKAFDVERARELRAAGWSYRKIGAELGVQATLVRRRLVGER